MKKGNKGKPTQKNWHLKFWVQTVLGQALEIFRLINKHIMSLLGRKGGEGGSAWEREQ